MGVCLSNPSVMFPQPLPEREVISFTPVTRESIASSFEVASISTTREELPYIEKFTVRLGKEWEGANFTGNSGSNAKPAKAKQTNDTIIVKADMLFFLFNLWKLIYKKWVVKIGRGQINLFTLLIYCKISPLI